VDPIRYTVIWNGATAQRGEFLVLGGALQDAVNLTAVFHTGAKKALVAMHNLGLQVVVASSDAEGDYLYYVMHKSTSLGDIVLGVYQDQPDDVIANAKVVETTYTTAIATNAWVSPMNGNRYVRAYGQFVLNAEGTAPNNWGILQNIEEISMAPSGQTRVYIPQTPEIEQITANFDNYFCFGREPIAEQELVWMEGDPPVTVQVFQRPAGAEDMHDTHVYVQGALAYSSAPWDKAFMYEYGIVNDVKGRFLSEERHVRDIMAVKRLIEQAYKTAIKGGNRQMARALIKALAHAEGQLSIYVSAGARVLADEFYTEFGDKAVIAQKDMVAVLAPKLHRPVVGIESSGLRWSLAEANVQSATDTEGIRQGRKEKPLTQREQRGVEGDLEILGAAGLCVEQRVEYFSFTNVDPNDNTGGVHESKDGVDRIGIRKDVLTNQAERRKTLAHEHRHLLTQGSGHSSFEFIDRADSDVVRLAEAQHERR